MWQRHAFPLVRASCESWFSRRSSVRCLIFIWAASRCGRQLIDGERVVAVAGFMSHAEFEYWGCVGVTLPILWIIWQCIIFKTCHTKDGQGLPCVWNYGVWITYCMKNRYRPSPGPHEMLPNWSLWSHRNRNKIRSLRVNMCGLVSKHLFRFIYIVFFPKQICKGTLQYYFFKCNMSLLNSFFWSVRIWLLSVNTQISN